MSESDELDLWFDDIFKKATSKDNTSKSTSARKRKIPRTSVKPNLVKQVKKQAAASQHRFKKRRALVGTSSSAHIKQHKKSHGCVKEIDNKWFYHAFCKYWLGPYDTEEAAKKAYRIHDNRWTKHYSIEHEKFEAFLKSMGYSIW
jgi:hypothetical protein